MSVKPEGGGLRLRAERTGGMLLYSKISTSLMFCMSVQPYRVEPLYKVNLTL